MRQLRIRCFQHVPFEGPAYVKDWAEANGHLFSTSLLYERTALPSLDELDFLVVMGGPMGVNDEVEHPWLVPEKAFIRRCIEAGKPVLGICLGAQLMASAMGAPVVPNCRKEIGWFPLQKTESGRKSAFLDGLQTDVPVFHWHGDTFGIPGGAKHLLRSEACVNQAFLIGERALALQFHLEMTPSSLQALVQSCGSELLSDEPFVQRANEILEQCELLEANNRQLAAWMEKLTEEVTKT